MKKLMFVAAAVACFGLNAEITSQNVVGYTTGDSAAEGFKLIAPQFKEVGAATTAVNIQDIKLGDGATSWSDFLQVVDNNAVGQTIYYYATAEESGYGADGWLSEDMGSLATVTLTPGQAVLLYTEATAKVNGSGEVSSEDTIISSAAGFNIIGNNSPVEIDIQSIKMGSTATSWSDFIQFANEQAVGEPELYYYATAEESGYGADGWLTPDMGALADIKIPAGKGFILYTENAGVDVTLPKAIQ